MTSDVYVIAKAVAEDLSLEHCGIYRDKTLKVVKGYFSTSSTDPGDSRPTADRRVSYWTAVASCRFPMCSAVAPVQTRATTKRTKWKVTSIRKLATTPTPNPNRDPVKQLYSTSTSPFGGEGKKGGASLRNKHECVRCVV
jgi:hypothetical protein